MISVDELRFLLPEYVNQKLEPDEYLHDKFKCPICGSGTHGGRDSDGALNLYGVDGVPKWHCHSCDSMGDIFDIIAFELHPDKDDFKRLKNHGVPFEDCVKKATAYYESGMPLAEDDWIKSHPQSRPCVKGEFERYLNTCRENLNERAFEYAKERGFTRNDVYRFNFGYDTVEDALVIPYGEDNSYYCIRFIEKKKERFRYPAGITKPIFNVAALDSCKPCFICEAQLDALSVMKCGYNAIAIGGAGKNQLIDQIKTKRPSCHLVISVDNDPTGWKLAEQLKTGIQELGIPVRIADWSNTLVKDCNEYLTTNINAFMEDLKRISDECDQYTEYGGVLTGTKDMIWNIIMHGERTIPTGYKLFDNAVGGGLPIGVTCFGAFSSMGKSAWLIESMFGMAANKEHVIYFSLEMRVEEIIMRMLSSITYRSDTSCRAAIPYGSIKRGNDEMHWSADQIEGVRKAHEKYYSDVADYLHVYTNAGAYKNGRLDITKIKSIIERETADYGKAPVVLIDYLQLIPCSDERADEKRAIDKNINELKALAHHFDTAFVLISSLNRGSYSDELNMAAFLGSSSIEYGADLLFVMQPQGYDKPKGTDGDQLTREDKVKLCKQLDARFIEIKLLKNRSGAVGKLIPYKFVAPYNVMIEGIEGSNKDIHNEKSVTDDTKTTHEKKRAIPK